jgi:hypothetical protein
MAKNAAVKPSKYTTDEHGKFTGSTAGMGGPVASGTNVVVANRPVEAVETPMSARDEVIALLEQGIYPVGIPVPHDLAREIVFENDERIGVFLVTQPGETSLRAVIGSQSDVRCDLIGTVDSEITFANEQGDMFDKDDYSASHTLGLVYRGREVKSIDSPEGLDGAIDHFQYEAELGLGAQYQNAYECLSAWEEYGIAGDEDIMSSLATLVYLHDEVEEGADVGVWSSEDGKRALRNGFSAMANTLPVEVIQEFALVQHGRDESETSRLLKNGENPFI